MHKTFKNILYQIHLWAGLIAGVFIFLICLSGTVLTFEKEIRDWFHPEEVTFIDPSLPKKNIDELAELLKDKGEVKRVTIQSHELPYIFNVQTSPEDRRGKNFYLNPITGEILNTSFQKQPVIMFFFKLHRWLLGTPESIGKVVVGIATIIFGLLLVSGFYLWWPRSKRILKNSLKINFSNSKKMIYDLHNTLGFYSLIPLMIMTLTGLCWSFEWYRDGLSEVLGSQVFGDRRVQALSVTPLEKRLQAETLIESVNKRLPYQGSISISFEGNSEAAWIVRKTPHSGLQFTDVIQINPYDSSILSEQLFSNKTLGAKISSLIRHLHTGEFYGILSKIIYFITCLIATTLPVTGTIMWLNKLKKKKKNL